MGRGEEMGKGGGDGEGWGEGRGEEMGRRGRDEVVEGGGRGRDEGRGGMMWERGEGRVC